MALKRKLSDEVNNFPGGVPQVEFRMGTCQGCLTNPAKYRCPGCSSVSCSVKCVLSHKKLSKCDGIRSKSKFVPLNEFSELDLQSDYQFLESANRCTENSVKNKLKIFSRKGENSMDLPPHLLKLRKASSLRKCKLLFLPPHFDRHLSNTSRVEFKTFRVFWKIEMVFVNVPKTIIFEKVDETVKLADLLKPYLEDCQSTKSGNGDPIVQDPFQIYRSKGFSGVRVILKAEGMSRKTRRFYSLDVKKSLVWNLQNKTIIENPIIYVVFADHLNCFTEGDIESGDEDQEGSNIERKSHVSQHNVKHARRDTYHESKNVNAKVQSNLMCPRETSSEIQKVAKASKLTEPSLKRNFFNLVEYSGSEEEKD